MIDGSLTTTELISKLMFEHGFDGLHHYTDFENFIKIYKQHILYCREEASSLGFVDGANRQVIENTLPYIKKHVRFYFKEDTPTLYDNEGIKRNCGSTAHMPIPVLLMFSEKIISLEDAKISNGCCASSKSMITDSVDTAMLFDWHEIFKRGEYGLSRSDPSFEIKKKLITNYRNAECLYPNKISLDYLKKIVFRCKADLKRAVETLGNDSLFCVDKNKFDSTGHCNDGPRNHLSDYIINRVDDKIYFELEFNDPCSGYDHILKVYCKSGTIDDLILNRFVDASNKINFYLNILEPIDRIKYYLNNHISAEWRIDG